MYKNPFPNNPVYTIIESYISQEVPMSINILYQDAHIIVCEKPAGTPTQSKEVWAKDMVSILKSELAKSLKSDKEPYLGLIHRLDQPVGGIMVFAKTPQATKELSAQLQKNIMKKRSLHLEILLQELFSLKCKKRKAIRFFLMQ